MNDFIKQYAGADENQAIDVLTEVIAAVLFHDRTHSNWMSKAVLRMRIRNALEKLVRDVRK